MILDTSFLIDLMEGNEEAVKKLSQVEDKKVILKVTPISAFELYYGALEYYDTKKERGKIKRVLEVISLLEKIPITWRDGKKAAEVMDKLKQEGEPVELPDAIIAALGLGEGEPILTGNPRHFARIRGVKVETY